jgi:hypothetical protein
MDPAPTTETAVEPRQQSGQEARIEAQRARITASRQKIIDLTLERAAIEASLATFEHEYAARVASLYGDLDLVQLDIKELLYRARLVEKGFTRSADHLQRRVDNAFRRERERVTGEPPASKPPPESRGRRPSSASSARPKDDPSDLRRLYLRLAKRYHPDKTEGDADPTDAERLMALINDAYESEDIRRLQQIAATLDDGAEAADETPDARERRLFREVLEVDRAAREIESDVDRIKRKDTYSLMRQAEDAQARGDDLVGGLRADLASKLDAARSRLKTVRSQFDTLAEATFASRRA